VLVGCVALFAVAPVAAAQAAGTASLTGTVTATKGGAALEGIEVTASGSAGFGTTTTGAGGKYTIAGGQLGGGSYTVTFSDPSEKFVPRKEFASLTEGAATTLNAAMQEPGSISGTVTSAATGTGLGGVFVSIRSIFRETFESMTTEASGHYTFKDLPPGTYFIEFFVNSGEYLRQNAEATVAEGAATQVNAALKEGGKISGTVTDAVTHGGLAKIGVYAFSANPEAEGYSSGTAETNASGAYTVTGLRSGSYKVEFYWVYSEAERKACEHAPQCPPKYILQYFNDQPSEATANTVGASEGSVTSGINAAMVPAAPVNTALPVVSGTPTVGDLLACSNGSWTGESEQKLSVGWPLTTPFTYQWLRDGGPIAGATTAAYVVQAVDVGHGLVCEVAATNDAGHASAKSNPVAVTPPAVTLSSTKIVVSGGSARVPIACANATCAGTIELTGQVAVKGKGKKKAKKKTVVLAKGSYSLAAGKKGTIAVRLTAAGRSALAKAKRHKLSGKAGVSVTGGKTVQKSVVLSETKKK
jgi:hypothetical protein